MYINRCRRGDGHAVIVFLDAISAQAAPPNDHQIVNDEEALPDTKSTTALGQLYQCTIASEGGTRESPVVNGLKRVMREQHLSCRFNLNAMGDFDLFKGAGDRPVRAFFSSKLQAGRILDKNRKEGGTTRMATAVDTDRTQ
ncbi:hypothetical protein KEM48_000005 [Puccinia striiformis f. sp. tritici PST-130]|nr:hypothetical protein KEM48_000005 [Puccinia striiformis f. sp. tritici PST-130]